MDKVIEILLAAVGVYAALGIWFPRLRGKWKGTKITIGTVSCAGFAVFFFSIGVISQWGDKVPEHYRGWLALPIVSGFFLASIGHALDSRAYARMSGIPAEPLVSPMRRWLLIVLGILLSIMLMKTAFFH